MKRMFVVLGILGVLCLWAISCLGQMSFDVHTTQSNAPFDRTKRRMELREEMHRRMMDKLTNGGAADRDLFKDIEDEMDKAMGEAFSSGTSAPSNQNSNFSAEWVESKAGRVLIITPRSKDQQLEIDTKPELITIRGKVEKKTATTTSVSSFSNSFSVPADCDGSQVKMSHKDGKIVMEFPYKSLKNVTIPDKGEERKPLAPNDSDVAI
jgi:HSP20 family molecular chaperone IbpA